MKPKQSITPIIAIESAVYWYCFIYHYAYRDTREICKWIMMNYYLQITCQKKLRKT